MRKMSYFVVLALVFGALVQMSSPVQADFRKGEASWGEWVEVDNISAQVKPDSWENRYRLGSSRGSRTARSGYTFRAIRLSWDPDRTRSFHILSSSTSSLNRKKVYTHKNHYYRSERCDSVERNIRSTCIVLLEVHNSTKEVRFTLRVTYRGSKEKVQTWRLPFYSRYKYEGRANSDTSTSRSDTSGSPPRRSSPSGDWLWTGYRLSTGGITPGFWFEVPHDNWEPFFYPDSGNKYIVISIIISLVEESNANRWSYRASDTEFRANGYRVAPKSLHKWPNEESNCYGEVLLVTTLNSEVVCSWLIEVPTSTTGVTMLHHFGGRNSLFQNTSEWILPFHRSSNLLDENYDTENRQLASMVRPVLVVSSIPRYLQS